jgi:hypothetical protein
MAPSGAEETEAAIHFLSVTYGVERIYLLTRGKIPQPAKVQGDSIA